MNETEDWYLDCPDPLVPVRSLWISLCERVCNGEPTLNPVCDELEQAFRLSRHLLKIQRCPDERSKRMQELTSALGMTGSSETNVLEEATRLARVAKKSVR